MRAHSSTALSRARYNAVVALAAKSTILKELTLLERRYPRHPLKINAKTPSFRTLVSTILSARTKDPVTVEATARLFEAISSPRELAATPEDEIARLVFPVGFYKTKAKHLREMAGELVERFDGIVPRTREELTALPGVGRKTANLVLSVAFGLPAICVDTHVHRLSNRLGWVSSKSVQETEQKLRKRIPKEHWAALNRVLVNHGQKLCHPVSPRCSECFLAQWCPRVGVKRSR